MDPEFGPRARDGRPGGPQAGLRMEPASRRRSFVIYEHQRSNCHEEFAARQLRAIKYTWLMMRLRRTLFFRWLLVPLLLPLNKWVLEDAACTGWFQIH